MPAWRLSLTLNWSYDKEVTSGSLFEFKSTGFGAPFANAKHTFCPFFYRILLHEVTLVLLNIAAD